MIEAEIEALELEMQMILTAETPDTEVGTDGSLEELEAEMGAILGR